MTLIPKAQKDILLLDNWRPSSLLNNDYDIIAMCLWKGAFSDIINDSQAGFLTGTHVPNNGKLVLDVLGYSELIEE